MSDEHEQAEGYVFKGTVQTGAIGTGASATVGAIGDGAHGVVFAARARAEEALVEEMLDLVAELRRRLEEHRDGVGERYEAISDNLDDLESSIEEDQPQGRIRSRLKALEHLVSPFTALVDLVLKLLQLADRRGG
ncbi:hypothetical protein [Glycomyces albidus]|jgi:hypothetical protein|uniref:Uncharacterized protein n=1 Tax=Glycomyces albidus TaxID=2656774 RepID=A0A6L5G8J6_9ACTN|nr:hypothetical protein [Glycomyces albidus]MQM26009.1 hypothetical protein [Glycomyces albidus]